MHRSETMLEQAAARRPFSLAGRMPAGSSAGCRPRATTAQASSALERSDSDDRKSSQSSARCRHAGRRAHSPKARRPGWSPHEPARWHGCRPAKAAWSEERAGRLRRVVATKRREGAVTRDEERRPHRSARAETGRPRAKPTRSHGWRSVGAANRGRMPIKTGGRMPYTAQ
ncbi:hypothetical protein K227x_58630 [Rubripirellula lacrimiformis]|uniref:Uncharacterized protein n=1 Tax=Rubripirellula lacrimiformis TaxID=1930273 RepID=A0A517NJY0_9BACT|nr:hypothetical protein K227x_58630 [Rubripirellula lacrimiformis]